MTHVLPLNLQSRKHVESNFATLARLVRLVLEESLVVVFSRQSSQFDIVQSDFHSSPPVG